MRRTLLLIALMSLAGTWLSMGAPTLAAQPVVPVQIGNKSLNKVTDWQSGVIEGLLVSNNADGELRLAENSKTGTFISDVFRSEVPFNAVGAIWHAEVPVSTTLKLEVRAAAILDEVGNAAWQPFAASEARSQTVDGALALESLPTFSPPASFLQFRASFDAIPANASPVLSDITINYIDASDGPPRAAGLPRVPAPYGPVTLTEAPQIIQRDTWGAPSVTAPVVRQTPRGIILHQIGNDSVADAPPFLRALTAYDTQVLGWDDLPYHFILDQAGTIYVGRSGGPTSAATRFSAGDAAIHVALIGNTTPPTAQQTALVSLLAWLGQAYSIAPTGQHTVASANAAATTRPNIVTHADISADVSEPAVELRALLSQLRQSADQNTVRARWYFAEGNPQDFQESLSVLNPGPSAASVRFSILRQPGPAVLRDTTIITGGRIELRLNDLFTDTTDAPAIIESNQPVIAERFLNYGNDISSSPGARQPSRVWYFAEGSTEGANKTYLLLFNPQQDEVTATVTYMQDNGSTAVQTVHIPPLQRTVVTISDVLPNVAFGAQVIANEPIVAERTMILGTATSTPTTSGATTSTGVVTLSRNWYFAEGTTQSPFQMNILVLNPNAQPTNVAVTFLTDSGTSLTRKYAVPPQTRLAINVNEVVPELGIATTISADRPIAAERAMSWSNTTDTPGPSATATNAGATTPAFTWRFADGRTNDGFQEYLLLSNPNKNQARVTIEFVLADGKLASQAVVMAGGSRYTLSVHQLYPNQSAISATVRSTQPIVAERSLYTGAPGTAANHGGATTLGVPEVIP